MHNKVKRIAGVGIFAAIVVVLQILATFIQIGPFAITLVLVPIVIGAALYGIGAGAMLGGVFGVVVLIMTISGADPGAYVLWVTNPVATLLVIMLRGILSGSAAGVVYQLFSHKNKLAAVVCAAIVCPVVNTGLFLLAMYFIFPSFLEAWADGAAPIYFLLVGLAGINFVIELVINIILSPTIVRILKAVRMVN
ncbi:MAG: ECF transporter S component [Defluviitaleaceae bacterium]|nr:ECF transporter S component [Defluviitaleaceae bacterium]